MSYTKGPWATNAYDDGAFEIRNGPWPHGFIIASRNGYADWKRAAESQANAYLIAAAPDLLAALENILNERGEEYGDCDYQSLWAAIEAAKPAIAKATAKGK